MGKAFKIIGIVAAACILLLIGSVVALVTLVDPNDYKAEITNAIYQQTGRTVDFTGDIHLSFFPWLGLEVGKLRIENPHAFGGGDFASIEGAGIHLKLMPLLKREVQVSTVTIDGLTVNLVRSTDGLANWEVAPDSPAPAMKPQSDSTPPLDKDGLPDSSSATPLAALLVESLAVNNANIIFTDNQAKTLYTARDLTLTTSAITSGKPVDITLKTTLAADAPKVEAAVDLHVSILLAHDFTKIDLTNMLFSVDAKGNGLPGGQLALLQQGALSYDLLQQICTIQSFSISAYDTTLTTAGTLNLADNATFKGQITLQSALRKALTGLGMQVQTADPKALETASMNFSLNASPTGIAISQLQGTLDDTEISGTITMQRFDRPDIRLALAATSLNLNRYLPPENSTAPSSAEKAPPTAQSTPQPTPSDATQGISDETKKALRTLLLDASLTVGSLTVQKVELKDMVIKATARDGLIRITPCSAKLFDGSYTADITADLRTPTTASALELSVNGVQLATLTPALAGEKYASGTATYHTQITAAGETWPTVSRSLNGDGSFAVTDGAIYGFQIVPDGAKSHIKGSNADKVDEAVRKQTFDRLSASYTIRSGRIVNNDLALVSPNLNASGAGYVDLPKDIIDYKGTIRITGMPDLPVSVSGSLTKPRYGFDAGAFLQDTFKGVENLLIPGSSNNGKQANPLKQLGKGLQQLFK